ncbi:MAG TPA: hypothetical protein VNT79_14960 [Phycisphaerae bacterium]|nr:hypothetical protein [Phycisphaerae bacterium]
MDLYARLEAILAAAEEIGLVVQKVPVSGDGGGLCVVKGERRLFVDTLADSQTRYERTLEALAGLPEMENVFLPPMVRQDLDREAGV